MDDKALKKLVDDELEWQPSIDCADVGVIVENGIVTLTGHVANYAQKIAAEAAVKRVKGVRGFVDRLEVQLFGAKDDTDEAIAERIANLLDWDVTVPKGAVKVQVVNGYVTLTGQVDWNYQRSAAEHGLRRLRGVRSLSNQIAVKPRVEAGDIKRRIEQALDRQADLTADNIRVTVVGDRVCLDGKVRAWTERDTIERAAWAAPGVKAVEDRVSIAI
jgi:osmotically-inducible protein OsmY